MESLRTVADPAGLHVTILGAGGAARAVAVELALAGAAAIEIVNRDEDRGRALAALLGTRTSARASYRPWREPIAVGDDTRVIVNATSTRPQRRRRRPARGLRHGTRGPARDGRRDGATRDAVPARGGRSGPPHGRRPRDAPQPGRARVPPVDRRRAGPRRAPGRLDTRRSRLTHRDESTRLIIMTKRLQVLLDEDELRTIQRLAGDRHTTTAEWVRQALRAAVEVETRPGSAVKLAALRRATSYAFPTGDIEQLLDETERGYLEPPAVTVFVDANVPMYLVGADHPEQGTGAGDARGRDRSRRAPGDRRGGDAGAPPSLPRHRTARRHGNRRRRPAEPRRRGLSDRQRGRARRTAPPAAHRRALSSRRHPRRDDAALRRGRHPHLRHGIRRRRRAAPTPG